MFGRHIISCVQRSLDWHSCCFACEQQATLQITCFCNTRISSNVELCICRICCKWARKTDFCYYHWTRPKSFKRPTKVNIVLLKFWYNDKTSLQSLHNALMHRVHTGASQHARGGQRMVWVYALLIILPFTAFIAVGTWQEWPKSNWSNEKRLYQSTSLRTSYFNGIRSVRSIVWSFHVRQIVPFNSQIFPQKSQFVLHIKSQETSSKCVNLIWAE